MKKLSMWVVIAVVLTLIVAGCGSAAPASPAPSKSPEAVLRAITEALNNKDVEAATALVADDVTQTLIPAPSGTGIYNGKEAMRARFKEVVAGNPVHKLTSCQMSGDKVTCAATYTDESIKPLGFDLEFNVEAVVQNGLLKTVTWTMTDTSLVKMQAAIAKAQGKDPESVLRAITEALNKQDAEAATAYLADDVTQTLIPAPSGTGIYTGKDALHARFKEVVAGNPVHKLTGCQTRGDKVTCAATYSDDSTKPLGFDLEFNVEAVVQNGLLKTVTWRMTDASLAQMRAALTAPTPAPTKPAAPLEPEVLAGKSEDVIGVWLVNLIEGAGKANFEFKPDGTYSIVGVSGDAAGVPIDSGKYEIKDNQLKLLDADCTTVKGDVIPCVPIYQVYVTRQGGKPVILRFSAVDDQGFERKKTLDQRKLTWVEQ